MASGSHAHIQLPSKSGVNSSSSSSSQAAAALGLDVAEEEDVHGGPGLKGGGPLHVQLKDVIHLVRANVVCVPSGFTKLGYPLLIFPASGALTFPSLPESDLHLLFKYYLSVVPRTEQGTGFALVIDRRGSDCEEWCYVQTVFQRVVTLFPARIREVYLIMPPEIPGLDDDEDGLGTEERVKRLVDDLLLDFDLFHMSDPTGLQHYIEPKCLPSELGGTLNSELESWLLLQDHVENFSFNARRIARRLAQFVGLLNQEDVNYRTTNSLREVAGKNRSSYRKLRKELEELTDHGLVMLKSLQRPDANVMQRLAVQVLCKQLDQAWTYFSRSWKMQDHVYVQYLELNTFQHRFKDLANTFAERERIVRSLPMSGSTREEVNTALDKLESFSQAMGMDEGKARDLAKLGQELMSDHNFATDSIQPKCTELKMMYKRLDMVLDEKRRILHQFLALFDSVEDVSQWCHTTSNHLDESKRRCDQMGADGQQEEAFSQIRQIDYLLSKSRELKLRSRKDFELEFTEIKDLMSAQTLFTVDDALGQLEAVTYLVLSRREELRTSAIRSKHTVSTPSDGGLDESMKVRRENILAELLSTESKYVSDLEEVLIHYKDKLTVSNLTETRNKALVIFGNLGEIHEFHSRCFLPQLEKCGVNPSAIARAIITNCQDVKLLYSQYCQNMSTSRQAIDELGGEQSASSILVHCQQEAGHQLPLSSYLLKPMQRLTKYQLLLKDLTQSSNVVCGKVDLEEALRELVSVIKVVNDSMHDINIKGLPPAIKPLGTLNAQESFSVMTENKGQSPHQIIFSRNRSQKRQVFVYDNQVLFCKAINEKNQTFQFKFSLGTALLGMSAAVKGEEKKIELWVHGRNEFYSLEAKAKTVKDNFAAELRKVIQRQKDHRGRQGIAWSSGDQNLAQVVYDTASSSTTTSTESGRGYDTGTQRGRSSARLARSRSLESSRANAPLRSRSLDCHADRSSPEAEDEDDDDPLFFERGDKQGDIHGSRYVVLADYMALTSREIDLSEDDVVEVVKVGCAGWWYIRITAYPYSEGWAPSTYLERVSSGYNRRD